MAELAQMPPPYSKGGYSKVPQADPYASQPGFQPYPPTSGYAPAPPTLQQQSTNTNVVVVGQPTAAPQTTVIHTRPRANEYLALTLVLMVICFIHGNLPAVLLLIPALICSCVASDHNNAGQYDNARQCGNMALGCNICVIVKYVIVVVVAVVLIIVYFTVGFSWLHTAKNTAQDVIDHFPSCKPTQSCSYDIYGSYRCTQSCN